MGKIKTEGRVTLEFEPDLYDISIKVYAEEKTSGAAVTAGKQQTEQLLQAFQDELGIKPEQISAETESAGPPNPYNDYSKDNYSYSRQLLLTIPADNKVREAVTAILAEMDCVTYSVEAKFANENKQKQIALDAAIQLAKEKADKIAASLHCSVSGFEEIFTDGLRESENLYDCAVACGSLPRGAKNLAAELKNPQIEISGEVTVVWLTEPLS